MTAAMAGQAAYHGEGGAHDGSCSWSGHVTVRVELIDGSHVWSGHLVGRVELMPGNWAISWRGWSSWLTGPSHGKNLRPDHSGPQRDSFGLYTYTGSFSIFRRHPPTQYKSSASSASTEPAQTTYKFPDHYRLFPAQLFLYNYTGKFNLSRRHPLTQLKSSSASPETLLALPAQTKAKRPGSLQALPNATLLVSILAGSASPGDTRPHSSNRQPRLPQRETLPAHIRPHRCLPTEAVGSTL